MLAALVVLAVVAVDFELNAGKSKEKQQQEKKMKKEERKIRSTTEAMRQSHFSLSCFWQTQPAGDDRFRAFGTLSAFGKLCRHFGTCRIRRSKPDSCRLDYAAAVA